MSRTGGAGGDTVAAFLESYGPVVATLLSVVSFGFAFSTAVAEGSTKGPDYRARVLPIKTTQAVLSAVPGLASFLRFPKVVAASEGASLIVLSGCDLLFGLPAGAVYIDMAEKGLLDPSNIE
jgi:hypothetical protein